jgi:hypothetical protein
MAGANKPAAAEEAAPSWCMPMTEQDAPARASSSAVDRPITPSPIMTTSVPRIWLVVIGES